ncbi:hypothetical protein ENUP19_0201G0005 [Entamoeba nuttalli]|uniref:Rab family GTPase n=1 Tax=Entamoeba nuttalli TaxID=412467 RepID=A0ABQ0DNK6_9EUKA
MTSNKQIKVTLVGESSVGKSSICNVISKGVFEKTSATIGAEFIKFNRMYKEQQVLVSLFDTSGEERYHSIPQSYYRKSNAVIMVYDISRKETFEQLEYWLNDVKGNCEIDTIICVGNKIDLERAVSKEDALEFARRHSLIYTETSAKTFEGVEDLVNEMIAAVMESNQKDETISSNENLHIEDISSQQTSYGCC